MRKTILGAVAGLLMTFAFFGNVFAAPAPAEDGTRPNDHGLCTAYFNGQKNGHDKHGDPPPFDTLTTTAENYTDHDGIDNDGDGDVDETDEHSGISDQENVFNYCDDMSDIGGNPLHGRYDCEDAKGPDGSNPDCQNNPAPGNS